MSQIKRDLDLHPEWRLLELFEGRRSTLFSESVFSVPEAGCLKGTLKS